MSKIRLNGTTSGYTEIAPPAVAGDNTVTLPSDNGSANQFLKNGSTPGTLGWSSLTERVSGEVGIGGTNTGTALNVSVPSGESIVRIHNAGTSSSWLVFSPGSSGTALIHNEANAPTVFTTSGVERARIDGAGNFGIGVASSGQKFVVENSGTARTAAFHSTSASYGELILFSQSNRSDSTAFSYFFAYNNSTADTKFILRGDGTGLCDGSWTGGGADYAEYFEWEDGNPDAEDRRGYPVALVGNKIKIAEDGDTIIGIVSAAPTVIGDAAWNHWSGKYAKDDFGSYIMEPHQVVEWTDEEGQSYSYEDWNMPVGVIIPEDAIWKSVDDNGKPFEHRKLNPDYDPTQPYVPREERPEWSPIGLMGKLRLRKGQPVAANWIKLRDISATVEEWLVR